MGSVVFLGFVALCLLAFGGTGTESGWTSASVKNDTDSALIGSVAITHTYGGKSCSTTVRTTSTSCGPTLGTHALPPAQSTDSITNNSGGAITQTVTGASCGVVQMSNINQTSDPLLPRSGTTFAPPGGPSDVSGSGAVTFDTTGYATGVALQTLGGTPGGLVTIKENDYGYGIWFKTTAANAQLFGLASVPTDSPSIGSTAFDRTLSLVGGKLVFAASGASTATTTATFNDGSWHYAYVSLTSSSIKIVVSLSITTNVSVYVDGASRATSSGGSALATPSGYWSIGGGGFAGSLSNFAVYNATNSSTSPPAAPYNSASELWPLNDTGYATATATLPAAISDPCSKVNIAFSFSNPSASITNSLSGFANGSAQVVAAPAAGQTQALTISTSRSGNSDIAGLHLYVPLTFGYAMGSKWVTSMTWATDQLDVLWA